MKLKVSMVYSFEENKNGLRKKNKTLLEREFDKAFTCAIDEENAGGTWKACLTVQEKRNFVLSFNKPSIHQYVGQCWMHVGDLDRFADN